MNSFKLLFALLVLQQALIEANESVPAEQPSVFREYIGALYKNVTFSDVPINLNVEFHFLLSFAIDYKVYDDNVTSPTPTNGLFGTFWDTDNLSPSQVSSIKSRYRNVRVGLSLGGDTVNSELVYFQPESITSWVRNAIYSITNLVRENNLDSVDVDYEHFNSDPDTFAECIGRLFFYLKQNNIVSYTSIAPFDDPNVQPHYLALWKKYSHLIDYVNFQFYAYAKGTNVSQFLHYFETQRSNYEGGTILVSFGTNDSGGLKPKDGFFKACKMLKNQGKLHGIFIWSADDSKKDNFLYEKKSQKFLVSHKV